MPRTAALRNRESILEVAKEAFTRYGADASLDDIAKQAGVAAGTVYRHNPVERPDDRAPQRNATS